VARHFLNPVPGSPQEALLEAVDARYRPREAFFGEVADRLRLKQQSASKAFYGFLDAERPLPAHHQAVYLDLLKIDAATLEAIDAARLPAVRPLRSNPLVALEAQVEKQGQEMTKALRGVTRRLQKLEEALERLAPLQGRQAPQARNKR
jgi:hypothetical protein